MTKLKGPKWDRYIVRHPQAPGTRLIGRNLGIDWLSLPGGTYADIHCPTSKGWVWKRYRWWHRVFRL